MFYCAWIQPLHSQVKHVNTPESSRALCILQRFLHKIVSGKKSVYIECQGLCTVGGSDQCNTRGRLIRPSRCKTYRLRLQSFRLLAAPGGEHSTSTALGNLALTFCLHTNRVVWRSTERLFIARSRHRTHNVDDPLSHMATELVCALMLMMLMMMRKE